MASTRSRAVDTDAKDTDAKTDEPTTEGKAGEGAPDAAAPGSDATPTGGVDGISGASDASTQLVGDANFSGGSASSSEIAAGDGADGDIPEDFPETVPPAVIPEGTPGIGFDNAPVIDGVVVSGGAEDLPRAFPDRPAGPSNPPAAAITSVPRTRVSADGEKTTNEDGDDLFSAESLAGRSREELETARDTIQARLDDVEQALRDKD